MSEECMCAFLGAQPMCAFLGAQLSNGLLFKGRNHAETSGFPLKIHTVKLGAWWLQNFLKCTFSKGAEYFFVKGTAIEMSDQVSDHFFVE
jgi:hypothetical protein